MNPKKIHNTLGLLLLLPLLGWIITGAVFLIKPGYGEAYEKITPNFYSLENHHSISLNKDWLEARFLSTILGKHLLVYSQGQWQQLNPDTLEARNPPSTETIHLLLADAISVKPQRYGQLKETQGDTYITTTGIELRLDWNTLSISQQGADTRLISTLHKIHYLQWLGHKQANTAFGVAGLISLALMVYYGMVLYLGRRKRNQ